MNRLVIHPKKQNENERVARQKAVLAAHQWSKLSAVGNRWAVYPDQPNVMFVFPIWNSEWSTADGKTIKLLKHFLLNLKSSVNR